LRIDLGVLLRFVLLLAMGTASNCRVANNMIRIAISDYRTLARLAGPICCWRFVTCITPKWR